MSYQNYYIIADLHLSEARPEATSLFAEFLSQISITDNTLFILGDFFDYWVGDDVISDFQQHIIKLLSNAHDQGLQVYFMYGNRDFLIGKTFARKAKLELIPDPYVLNLEHKAILLMHGDLLCTDDKSYQIFRQFVRNKLIQKLYLALPRPLRQKIAQKIRGQSKHKNAQYKVIDVTEKGIQKYLNQYQTLIHGHTHMLNVHYEKGYTRYVLGDWFNSGSYIHIDTNENISLVSLTV